MVEAVAAVPRSALVVGSQLAVFWVIMRVLDELSRRGIQVAQDLERQPCKK
jgi:hypothetical protein